MKSNTGKTRWRSVLKRPSVCARRDSGVALIIMLSVMVTLSLLLSGLSVFSIANRRTVRTHSDALRAQELALTALARAMDEFNYENYWIGFSYPHIDAWGSWEATNAVDVALVDFSMIPVSLSNEVQTILEDTGSLGWLTVTNLSGETYGRVAFLAVNVSGLVDMNAIGRERPAPDVTWRPESYPVQFYEERSLHGSYESLRELADFNTTTATNIYDSFIFSYDPDPDVYVVNTDLIGRRDVELHEKLRLNEWEVATGGSPVYSQKTNLVDNFWYTNLTAHLAELYPVNEVTNITVNLINYLDEDRLPHQPADGVAQWLTALGQEAAPLINEIYLVTSEAVIDDVTNTVYDFSFELWYPFVPDSSGTNFSLEVAVWTNQPSDGTGEFSQLAAAQPQPELLLTNYVPDMEYGEDSKFHIEITTPASSVWLLARIVYDGYSFSQVPDLEPVEFSSDGLWQIDDPRGGYRWSSWKDTLGTTNVVMSAWDDGKSGLPLFHRDGPMEHTGEIGHIWRGPVYDADGLFVPWYPTVDLLHVTNGVSLLDRITAREHPQRRGLININTDNEEAFDLLFEDAWLGVTNGTPVHRLLSNQEISALRVHTVGNGPYNNWADLLGVLSKNQDWLEPNASHPRYYEDALRRIFDRVTFRQNLFLVFIAAEPLSGAGRPLARARICALVARDAYTGRWFIQSWRRLESE